HLKEQTTTTSQIKIDDFVKITGIIPDVFSIDVEGSEFNVIRGMAEVTKRHRPLIYVSIHEHLMADMYGTKIDQIFNFIRELGYEDRYIATDHEAHWLFKPK
ncbi:MAG: FkbM family methyltransferase, partial [Bacteroidota bacterium]